MATVTETYDAILSGLDADLSPEAAQGLLAFGFSQTQQRRMAELAAKARSGELSDEESMEANNYEQVSSLLGVLQSRARMALKRSVS